MILITFHDNVLTKILISIHASCELTESMSVLVHSLAATVSSDNVSWVTISHGVVEVILSIDTLSKGLVIMVFVTLHNNILTEVFITVHAGSELAQSMSILIHGLSTSISSNDVSWISVAH